MRQMKSVVIDDLPFYAERPPKGRMSASIEALDLGQVRRKLMEPAPEGKGWTEEYALFVEIWYRRFLHVCVKYPENQTVPNLPIDTFWHQHILDTRAYAKDCQTIFGFFLHHYPYFGLNGDAPERDSAFDDTNAIYRTEFGEDCKVMVARKAECGQACCGNSAKSDVQASSTCVPEACSGGGTCQPCTVDKVKPASSWLAREILAEYEMAQSVVKASSCGHGGSGTGCGQGCRRGS